MSRHFVFDVTQGNDPRRTGIGRVVEEQIRSLAYLLETGRWPFEETTLVSAWEFRLPEDLKVRLQHFNVQMVVLPFKSMYLYRLLRLPLWCRRNAVDVLFVPEPIDPGIWWGGLRGNPKRLVMLYDLITRQSPKTVSRHIRFLYQRLLLPTLRSAHGVGVDSEYVRRETALLQPGLLEKSRVLPIYLHEPDRFAAQAPTGFDAEKGFALFVGNLMPHKNIRRVLEAFERLKQSHPGDFIRLGIVGRLRPKLDDLAPRLAELTEAGVVHHFGYLKDEEITWLYRNARFLIFPSLIEGYGLPIMEAMSQGCPVITARGGATEETADGAARLVDPLSVEDIHAALVEFCTSSEVRKKHQLAGLAHARRFTREHHALAFLQFVAEDKL
ncbi:MAG: glycosyltransferase family 1 protein [Candidatus Sumerlaeia bacterium]|nr:glycosyltransferase family 1 protein [Candidatus Sumerlaeia bacterium]